MLKLKLQYFGHLMWRADSLEKTLMLGGIGGRRKRGRQRMRWLDGITNSMDVSLSELRRWWWTGRPGVLQSMRSQRVGHNWATELNWAVYQWTEHFASDINSLRWYKSVSIYNIQASPRLPFNYWFKRKRKQSHFEDPASSFIFRILLKLLYHRENA